MSLGRHHHLSGLLLIITDMLFLRPDE
ncbi:hypothetical protein LINGRAHAP2_LOCUS30910 [Linum grandiflorum]